MLVISSGLFVGATFMTIGQKWLRQDYARRHTGQSATEIVHAALAKQ
jgi:hypothetical protein